MKPSVPASKAMGKGDVIDLHTKLTSNPDGEVWIIDESATDENSIRTSLPENFFGLSHRSYFSDCRSEGLRSFSNCFGKFHLIAGG